MSRIDSWHWKISTGRYFQNGHHNIAKIQHCPISSQFDMWVDNDVRNDSSNWTFFYQSIFKMATTIPHKLNFNDISYVGRLWCPELVATGRYFQNGHHNISKNQHCPISSQFDMWVDNDVLNWFPTLKNFYQSPFLKWPPQYHTNWTLPDFNAISHVGRLWCSELIPDIEQFLLVAIFKMATTISQKFNIVRYHQNLTYG